jgi:hypothetical protein
LEVECEKNVDLVSERVPVVYFYVAVDVEKGCTREYSGLELEKV